MPLFKLVEDEISESESDTSVEYNSDSESLNYLHSSSTSDDDEVDSNFELQTKIIEFNQIDNYHSPTVSDQDIINAYRWKSQIDNLQLSWYPSIENYCPNFRGYVWRLCDNWFTIIDIDKDACINYLEVGTLCGANIISVCKNFTNPHSTFECIDPWEDYEDYDEYKLLQNSNFVNFLHNIRESGEKNRITYYKDYSHSIFPILTDESYNIIYIDGNHKSWAVLEDGVYAFRKLKKDGWLIFDDYTFSDETKFGIDCFISSYQEKIKIVIKEYGQCFVQKK